MKRARTELGCGDSGDGGRGSQSHQSHHDHAPFSFGFALGGVVCSDGSSGAPTLPATRQSARAPANVPVSFTTGAMLKDYVDPLTQWTALANTVVSIDWETSSCVRLRVRAHTENDSEWGEVPPSYVVPLLTEKDLGDSSFVSGTPADSSSTKGDASGQGGDAVRATVFDAVWARPSDIVPPGSLPHFSSSPLTLEPGLQSLVWPLTSSQFLRMFYRRAPLAIHAAGSRVGPQLTRDLAGLDVTALIQQASRTVVWMRDRGSGRMQYVEAGPDLAGAAFRSGHSLYFNPPPAVQREWLLPLALDLGMGAWGATADGGLGGDIEVFAVAGRHVSPWHWDAQDNFTLQLRGTKKWSVAASNVSEPITNLHPSSANARALQSDVRLHGTYVGDAAAALSQPSAGPSASGGMTQEPDGAHAASSSGAAGWRPGRVTTFLLRPGSVLYTPAGVWHRVEAEDEGGSLHINFSLSGGGRWGEAVLRRLLPCLWAAHPGWRARLASGPIPEAYSLGDEGRGGGEGCSAVAAHPAASTDGPAAHAQAASDGCPGAAACGPHPARTHVASLLRSLRAVVATLTPDDVLPDALLHAPLQQGSAGSGARHVARAHGRRDGEEEEDGDGACAAHYEPLCVAWGDVAAGHGPPAEGALEGSPFTSGKALRRAVTAGALAGAGTTYASALDVWARCGGDASQFSSSGAQVTLVRSPLIFLEPSSTLPVAGGAATLPGSSTRRPTWVTVYAVSGVVGPGGLGGALDGSSATWEPDFRVPLVVDARLQPLLQAVASLRPAQRATAEQLHRALDARGAGFSNRRGAADVLRCLVYAGILRLEST